MLSVPKVDSWSLQSFQTNSAAKCTRFETKRPNTLHKPENNTISVQFVGGWSPQIVPLACDAICRRLARMAFLRYIVVSGADLDLCNFKLTPAPLKNVKTLRAWSVSFSENLE